MALPARDVLAFCDAKSLQGIVELKQLVRRITPKGEHLLTETLSPTKWGVVAFRVSIVTVRSLPRPMQTQVQV